jgi:hypothetical protein
MDRIEVENLVIVLPNGMPWTKNGPRAGKQSKRDPPVKASLSNVAVRQFGDTAVLTGTLTLSGAAGSDNVGTTVVFVKQAGKWLIAPAQWTPLQAPKQ